MQIIETVKKFAKFGTDTLVEEQEDFDSWNISNLSILSRRIHLEIINSYNFNSILDFGCGKGALTHLLKK